jgi:predicted nucleic acid-binding protein
MKVVLDTNMLIDAPASAREISVYEGFVTALSYAELAFGLAQPSLSVEERVRRQDRLNRLKAAFGAGLPFDDSAAASYGLIAELVLKSGRSVRGRQVDLMIAAVAHANSLPVLTRDISGFSGIGSLVEVLGLPACGGGAGAKAGPAVRPAAWHGATQVILDGHPEFGGNRWD